MFSFQINGESNCPKCGFSLENDRSLSIDKQSHFANVCELGYLLEDETGAQLILDTPAPEIICENCLANISDEFSAINES